MSMTATELRKLASLMLSPEQMAGVLELLADRVEADDSRRAAAAERKRQSRSRHAPVTGQTCDSDVKKEIPHTPLEKTTHTENQPTRAKPGKTEFPDDFQLSPQNLTVAMRSGYSPSEIDVEIQRMRNWSKNADGAKGRKSDWQRFAFNWFTDKRKSHAASFTNRQTPASKLADAFDRQHSELVEIFGELSDGNSFAGPGI